ncbi:Nose resistant-to-fluoxetine protein, N-terminal domain [Popillia japonica]|uniref:Nose resistant-to-fluoxetine protein, N-terminal domain n=1 Tax=Popillia japonica TaxID=7064 RepID=A0AAW1LS95_POPJA
MDLFPILPIAATESGNKQCKEDSILYVESLNNLTLWAYEMWDATAKLSTGSLNGNIYQFGNWHECRKTNAPFNTQYCLAEVTADVSWLEPNKDPYSLERNPFGSVLKRILNSYDPSQLSRDTVYIGWCLPASCSTIDLEIALNNQLNKSEIGWCLPASCSTIDLEIALNNQLNKSENTLIQHNVTYHGKILEDYCQRQGEEKKFDTLDGIFCLIFIAMLLLVLIATFYELKLKNELTGNKNNIQDHSGSRRLLVFSAYQNFISLAKHDDTNPALTPLYGLRTISIFMIVVGHKFALYASASVLNFDYIEEQYRSTMAKLGLRTDLYVDSFFVLSGLLLTYSVMVQYKKKIIHPKFLIFLRYMRLTPLLAFVIFFYATLYNYIGSGPF